MPELYLGINTRELKRGAQQIVSGLDAAARSADTLQKGFDRLDARIAGAAKQVLALVGAYKALDGVKGFVQRGIEFNSSLESSKIGIATLITSMVDLEDAQGKALEGVEKYAAAQGIAADMMQEIQRLGLETTATTQELVQGVQTIMGSAVQAGIALKDIPQFAVAGAQAMQTLGIPLEQMRTELDALLTGRVNGLQDVLAPRLFPEIPVGQLGEYLRGLKSSGTLLDEINKRLEPFRIAGQDVAQTWRGLSSNLSEALDVLAGKSGMRFTDSLKESANILQKMLINTGGQTTDISSDFQNIAFLLTEIEGKLGDTILSSVQSLANLVRTANRELQNFDLDAGLDELTQALKAVAMGYAAVRVSRSLATKAQGEGIIADMKALGLLQGLKEHILSYDTALQKKIQANKDAAKAELVAADAVLTQLEREKALLLAQERRAASLAQKVRGTQQEERAEKVLAATRARLAAINTQLAASEIRVTAAQAAVIKTTKGITLAQAAWSGLKTAVNGVLSLFGGPLGLIFTAATTAFGYLGTAQSEAEKYAIRHAAAMRAVSLDTKEAAEATAIYTERLKGMTNAQLKYERASARNDLEKLAHDSFFMDPQYQVISSFFDFLDPLTEEGKKKMQDLYSITKDLADWKNITTEQIRDIRDALQTYAVRNKQIDAFEQIRSYLESLMSVKLRYELSTDTLEKNTKAQEENTAVARQAIKENYGLADAISAINKASQKMPGTVAEAVEWLAKRTAQSDTLQKTLEKEAQAYDQAAIKVLEYAAAQAEAGIVSLKAKAAAGGGAAEEKAILEKEAEIKRLHTFIKQAREGLNDIYSGRTKRSRSGGVSDTETARKSIEAIRLEIREMTGESERAFVDMQKKLSDIGKAGQGAHMAAEEIKTLKEEYQRAFQTKTLDDFNAALLEAQGNTSALKEIQLNETLNTWEDKFRAAGMGAEETASKLRELREALIKQDDFKDLETAANFYEELSALSGEYGKSLEYQNELINHRVKIWEEAKIPIQDITERARLMRQEISRDPFDGLIRGARKFGAEYGNLAQQVESFTTQMGDTIANTLSDAFMTGELSAKDFFNSLISMAAQAASNAFVGQIFGGIGGFFGGSGEKSGVASSKTGGTSFIDTVIDTVSNVLPFATGGIASPVGLSRSGGILLRPTFFHDGAGRAYAQGGLSVAGEAGPEVFMPATRMSDGNYGVRVDMGDFVHQAGSSFAAESAKYMKWIATQNREIRRSPTTPDISVNIINQTGVQADAQTQIRSNGNGGFTLDILLAQVEQGIVSRAKSGRSALMQYQEKAYGLSRAGVLARGKGRA